MGVNDSIRAYNGVITWVNNNNIDFGEPKKKSYRAIDRHLNSVFREFGKSINVEMHKDNSRAYKGTFSPAMANCKVIQDHWEEFKQWAKKNYIKK